jgi:hypothetical protein
MSLVVFNSLTASEMSFRSCSILAERCRQLEYRYLIVLGTLERSQA